MTTKADICTDALSTEAEQKEAQQKYLTAIGM
jgi:hypothetical protein